MVLPAKRVAVIGAGISGVCAAAHLLKLGIKVVLFERSETAGGVWHFDRRVAADPSYPSEDPSTGDYQTSTPFVDEETPFLKEEGSTTETEHAPPGPCYAGLKNNVSTRLMRTSLLPWPPGTEDFVSQSILEKYIQEISDVHGVRPITEYNTRVEEVREKGNHWHIRTRTLRKAPSNNHAYRFSERHWIFGAVIVASGHYNAPRVPDFSGLAEWKQRFPGRIQHSKSYRDAEVFRDKTVLLIGAGVSSCDIAKELSAVGANVYQSSRGGMFDLPVDFLPKGVTRTGGVVSFSLDNAKYDVADCMSTELGPREALPGAILLYSSPQSSAASGNLDPPMPPLPPADTIVLRGVHHVILCTGYMISYPFLPQYHFVELQPSVPSLPSSLSEYAALEQNALTTRDGTMVHNLHLDTFFIPNPSLAFVGTPYHIATFSLFDFQAQAVARAFAGFAELPSAAIMRSMYECKVRERGLGRDFHSLRREGEEERFVRELVRWANMERARLVADAKVREMEGHTEEWYAADRDRRSKLRRLRESNGRGWR